MAGLGARDSARAGTDQGGRGGGGGLAARYSAGSVTYQVRRVRWRGSAPAARRTAATLARAWAAWAARSSLAKAPVRGSQPTWPARKTWRPRAATALA